MAKKRAAVPVLEAAKEVSESRLLTAKGTQRLAPAEFWRETKAYPRGDGSYPHYQLYRLFPVIDRTLGEGGREAKSVIANEREMDEGWILAQHGSGHYQVFFIDLNARPTTRAKTVVELDAEFWEHPPVLDQRELVVGHPKNAGYIEGLKGRGLWKRDEQLQERNDMAETATASAANTAVQELSSIAKGAIAKSGERQPADEAAAAAVRIMETGFKSAVAAIQDTGGKKGSSGEMMLIVQMMQEQGKRQHEVFMELLRQQGRQQNPAPAASIDKEISVVQKMMEFAKTLGGAPASWTDRLPEMAVPLLTALISRAAAPVAPPAAYPPPPQYPAFAPPASLPVAAAPPAAAPESVSQDDAMMPMILSQMGVPPEAMPVALALVKMAGRAVQMFRAGVSGYAFAAELERTQGEDTYGLVWSGGLSELLGFLAKFGPLLGPENSAMVASPEFHAWLADFFAYGKQAGYGDSEETDAAPAGTDAGAAE